MYKPKLEKDIRCPLEYGLEIFGGKWKSRIIRDKVLPEHWWKWQRKNIKTICILKSCQKKVKLKEC